MKKLVYALLVVCMVFIGCNKASDVPDEDIETENLENTQTVVQDQAPQGEGANQEVGQNQGIDQDKYVKYYDLLDKCKEAQHSKKFQEAIEIAKQMIAIDENNCIAYAELGYIYISIKKTNEAKKYLEKANSLNPNDVEVQRYLKELNYEELLNECKDAQDSKNFQEAIDIANKLIELNKDNAIAYAELGHIYTLVDNKAEAKKYLEKALSLNPNDIVAKRYLEDVED